MSQFRGIAIMALTSDERRLYRADYDATLAALQADPDEWAEYQWARSAWDTARGGGPNGSGGGGAGRILRASRSDPDRVREGCSDAGA